MKRFLEAYRPENSGLGLSDAPYLQRHGQGRDILYSLDEDRCKNWQHCTETGYEVPPVKGRAAFGVAQLVGCFGIVVGVQEQRDITDRYGYDKGYPVRHAEEPQGLDKFVRIGGLEVEEEEGCYSDEPEDYAYCLLEP